MGICKDEIFNTSILETNQRGTTCSLWPESTNGRAHGTSWLHIRHLQGVASYAWTFLIKDHLSPLLPGILPPCFSHIGLVLAPVLVCLCLFLCLFICHSSQLRLSEDCCMCPRSSLFCSMVILLLVRTWESWVLNYQEFWEPWKKIISWNLHNRNIYTTEVFWCYNIRVPPLWEHIVYLCQHTTGLGSDFISLVTVYNFHPCGYTFLPCSMGLWQYNHSPKVRILAPEVDQGPEPLSLLSD